MTVLKDIIKLNWNFQRGGGLNHKTCDLMLGVGWGVGYEYFFLSIYMYK